MKLLQGADQKCVGFPPTFDFPFWFKLLGEFEQGMTKRKTSMHKVGFGLSYVHGCIRMKEFSESLTAF